MFGAQEPAGAPPNTQKPRALAGAVAEGERYPPTVFESLRLENPFFVREVRQLGHRPLPVQLVLVALVVLMSASFGLMVWIRRSNPAAPIQLLVGPHVVLCGFAGAFATDRIFGQEHRRSTLEATLLLPLTALRWLLLRLAFPAYAVALVWLAGVPIYVLASLWRIAPFEQLLAASRFGPLLGLGLIPVLLVLPPDYQERVRRSRMSGGVRLRPVDRDLAQRSFLLSALALFAQMELVSAFTGATRLQLLYTTVVPRGVVAGVVAVLVVLAALLSALSVLSPDRGLERWAGRARLLAVTALYYIDLGVLLARNWDSVPLWLRGVLLVVVPVLVAALMGRPGRPKEDRLALEEVEWLAGRWDNPLLTRDMRVYTRGSALRRAALYEAGGLLVLAAVLVYVVVGRGHGTLTGLAAGMGGLVLFLYPLLLLAESCARPFSAWARERASGSLELLFLTPLTSREILQGRLLGASFYALTVHCPLLVLYLISAGAVLRGGISAGVLAIVSVSPTLALFAVAFGSAIRNQGGAVWKWKLEDWLETILGLGQVGILYGMMALLFGGFLEPGRGGSLLALGLFAVNALLAWLCYRLRVRQLEGLREGRLELAAN